MCYGYCLKWFPSCATVDQTFGESSQTRDPILFSYLCHGKTHFPVQNALMSVFDTFFRAPRCVRNARRTRTLHSSTPTFLTVNSGWTDLLLLVPRIGFELFEPRICFVHRFPSLWLVPIFCSLSEVKSHQPCTHFRSSRAIIFSICVFTTSLILTLFSKCSWLSRNLLLWIPNCRFLDELWVPKVPLHMKTLSLLPAYHAWGVDIRFTFVPKR
jgi:hypothetical protein